MLIRICAFCSIFKDLTCLRVDADFISLAITLDIEGVTQAGAAALLLQLLIGNRSGARVERCCSRLRDCDLRDETRKNSDARISVRLVKIYGGAELQLGNGRDEAYRCGDL